jgi:Mce-associated membrane protein
VTGDPVTGDSVTASARSRRRAWLAASLLLAAAAAFAGWAGWSYQAAASSTAVTSGQLRDQALQAGTREIAELNSVSDTSVASWQARWLADTTGAEHTQIEQTDPAAAAQIKKIRTSSSASVTGAALIFIQLNGGGGAARLIATVRVVQTADAGETNTITNRYLAALTLTPSGWKISSLLSRGQ